MHEEHEEVICKTEDDMLKLGNRFGEVAKPGMVISLRGSLGAGKTVLLEELLEA